MTNTYACAVCGSQRTVIKCASCDQLEALNKISSANSGGSFSSSNTNNTVPFDGTEWWLASTSGQITGSIVSSIFAAWFAWDWVWSGITLIELFVKLFIIAAVWGFMFFYWPFIIAFAIIAWAAYHTVIFLFTTRI